jgi:hypothetical protein
MEAAEEFSSGTLAAVSLVGRSGGLVKRLRGFSKDRHTVPDAVNAATEAFFARICAAEVAEEGEEWFQRAREVFGYKRREVSLATDGGVALLSSADFAFEVLWSLDPAEPSSYLVTRTLRALGGRGAVVTPEADRVFAGAFSEIVFSLTRGVRVEDVVDAVEALAVPVSMSVSYPASCAECTIAVEGVDAVVRCTGATLELVFPRAGSPRELLEAFGRVRSAFRFTGDAALVALL